MIPIRQPAPWQPRPAQPRFSAARRAGRAARWALRAPADRLTLPAAGAIWGAGEILHATGVPALDVGVIGLGAIPAVTYGVVLHRGHRRSGPRPRDRDDVAWRAGKASLAMVAAAAWATAAARFGATAGPGILMTDIYVAGAGIGYAVLRADEAVRMKRDWRNEKIRWHQVSGKFGLQGSHLLHSEKTRLGHARIIDVTGTGKRASMIAGRDTAERIAEHYRLPAARVQVTADRIAGRVRISVRDRDPWANPVMHPVLDSEPEIQLPETQSITDPLTVGMDPESGRPLTLTAYDPEDFGGQAIMIIATRGSGKTILLNDIMERLTACDDVLVWDINLSKAKENRRWAPACDLTAHGPGAKRDALAILRLARKAIEYRGNSEGDDAIHQPSPHSPAIVVRVDEMDTLLGGQGPIDHAIREEMNKLNGKGRSEGVVTIIAGQRAVQTHVGSADIRANVDTVALSKVRGRSEMMHAAGDMGMDLPDMTTYGEGYPGVWIIAPLGGDHQTGRTFLLKHLPDIASIAESRSPRAALEPGLREYLGDQYERLKTGDVAAHTVTGDPQAPAWMADLGKELEEMSTDVFDQFDQIAARNADTRRQLEQMSAEELIELGPEHAEALARAIAERNHQAAMTVEIPAEHRTAILAALEGGGAAAGELATRLGVARQTVWRYLHRLRVEGVVEMRGKGRGARWHGRQEDAG